MVVSETLATPEIGAGEWISGLFHVEQFIKSRFIPDDSRESAAWKIM
jgi:hypothetical protein